LRGAYAIGAADVTVGIVAVLFVAAALVAVGAFIAAWRRNAAAALAGIPLMFGGAGVAFAGVARFSARAAAAVQAPTPRIVVPLSGPPLGQEAAVLFAIVAVAAVAVGFALAARAGGRSPNPESSR
jgi:NADH:ubiquinone oxidoreductase subunit K